MHGVVFLGNRKLELREFPDPTPGAGEVVLAIKASGMCGSDFHAYRAMGDAAASLGLGSGGGPVIAGHEPCGVVHAVGAGVDPGLVGSPATVVERLHTIYEEVGGFGTLLLFCFDYAESPEAWRHSMELLAREVMPKFKELVPR